MSSYGRQLLNQGGRVVQLTADGKLEVPTGGTTVDWNTVAPVANNPVTLMDDTVVQVGNKYLRYGQVLALITSTANGGKVGYWGPYDPAATDGRQTLGRGTCRLVNMTTLMLPSSGVGSTPSDHPATLIGGRIWRDRLLAVPRDVIVNPPNAPTVNATGGGASGGALGAGTYRVAYSIVGSSFAPGETLISPETVFTIAAGNIPQLIFPATPLLPGQSYNVYLTAAGGGAGTGTLYKSGLAGAFTNLEIAIPGGGAAVPGANTTGFTVASLAAGPAIATVEAALPRLTYA